MSLVQSRYRYRYPTLFYDTVHIGMAGGQAVKLQQRVLIGHDHVSGMLTSCTVLRSRFKGHSSKVTVQRELQSAVLASITSHLVNHFTWWYHIG